MVTLTPAALENLDRVADPTPADLAEIKNYLGLATDSLLDGKLSYEDRCAMAYGWVEKATDLFDLVVRRLGYTLPE